jgi:F-type H+-transporting ATPase subunit b
VRTTIETLAKEQVQREHDLMERLAGEARSAETRIAAAKQAALANVRTIAVEAAQAATARLVGDGLPASDIEAAVTRALEPR